MTAEQDYIYVFDSHLDDSQQWETGMHDCYACGYEFAYVRRVDQPRVVCPRCIVSNRWKKRPVYEN